MKRIISLLTAFLLSVLILPFAAFATDGSLAHFMSDKQALTFTDVSSGDWFAPYVKSISKTGLMIGVGGNRFAPESDITLAEVYTVTARIHAIYHTGSAEAADGYDNQADKPWFYGYVKYCMDNGIQPGEPGDVTQTAFRIECASLLSRALPKNELAEINTVAENAIPDLPFSQNTENVYLLYRAGVLTGLDEAGNFFAESKIRRCEVAAIVSRLIDPTLRMTMSGLDVAGGADSYASLRRLETLFYEQSAAVGGMSPFNREYQDITYNIAYLEKLYHGETPIIEEERLNDWVDNIFLKKTIDEQNALPTMVQAVRELGITREQLTMLNEERKKLGDDMILTDEYIAALFLDENEMKEKLINPTAYMFDGAIYTWEKIVRMTPEELAAIGLDEKTLKNYVERVIEYCAENKILDEKYLRAYRVE